MLLNEKSFSVPWGNHEMQFFWGFFLRRNSFYLIREKFKEYALNFLSQIKALRKCGQMKSLKSFFKKNSIIFFYDFSTSKSQNGGAENSQN